MVLSKIAIVAAASAISAFVVGTTFGFIIGRSNGSTAGDETPSAAAERASCEAERQRLIALETAYRALSAQHDQHSPETKKKGAQGATDPSPSGKPGTKATAFVSPEVDGVSIDACLSPGEHCGQAAADAFCQFSGFAKAIEFATAQGGFKTFGMQSRAIVCGENEGETCTAFDLVVCDSK